MAFPKTTTAADIRKAAKAYDAAPERFAAATKFAVWIDGKAYPPKAIISLATGMPVQMFSGGDKANKWLAARGFEVKPLT